MAEIFIGDVVEVFVDHADLFNDEGGCGDGQCAVVGELCSSATAAETNSAFSVLFPGSSGRGGVVL